MRKIGAMLLCIAFLLALAVPASAATTSPFLHSYYEVTEDTLQCLGAELPSGGTLTVTAGSQKAADAEYSTVAAEDLPTTVYCLVDTSSGMSNQQAEQQKKVLLSISSAMSDGDCMVIATLGDTLKESQPLTDRAARDSAINAISRKGAYTNLFQAIVECMEVLSTRSTYSTNRCLVILSDGIDDGQTSTTEQAVVDAIRESTVPVYGVAVVDPYPGWWTLEHAKQLQRFSDASVGGIGYIPVSEDISPEEVGVAIWQSMQNSSVIKVDLDSVPRDPAKDTLSLMVRYETADARYEDTMTVYTVDLPEAETQPTAEPTEETIPETTAETTPEEEEPSDEEDFPWWIVIAVAVAVAAVGIAVVLIVRKKSSSSSAVSDTGSDVTPVDNLPANAEVTDVPVEPVGPTIPGDPLETGSSKDTEPTSGCQVHLTALRHKQVTYDFFLPDHCPKTLGRNNKANIVINPEDPKLSGKHCEMEWDGSRLYMHDCGSTNGSFINGVPVQPNNWMPLEDNATLRIGSYEYRVKLEQIFSQE